MNASFFDRLGAYVLDALLIFAISSVISVFIPNKGSDIEKEMTVLLEEYTNGEMDAQAYLDKYSNLTYQYQKENWVLLLVSVSLSLIYYVVFAWYNKGQTIAKKLMNIKVVDNKTGNKPIFIQMFLRNMIIYSLLSSIVMLVLLFVGSKIFVYTYIGFAIIELLFVILTVMFVLYRKDKRGLHDIMSGTKVIKESV